MKPEDFRKLLIKPGTALSLSGEYGSSSVWGDKPVRGTLTTFLVVERDFTLWAKDSKAPIWDTAIILSLEALLHVTGLKSEEYAGNQLLLLHRHNDLAWDNNDPDVHV